MTRPGAALFRVRWSVLEDGHHESIANIDGLPKASPVPISTRRPSRSTARVRSSSRRLIAMNVPARLQPIHERIRAGGGAAELILPTPKEASSATRESPQPAPAILICARATRPALGHGPHPPDLSGSSIRGWPRRSRASHMQPDIVSGGRPRAPSCRWWRRSGSPARPRRERGRLGAVTHGRAEGLGPRHLRDPVPAQLGQPRSPRRWATNGSKGQSGP